MVKALFVDLDGVIRKWPEPASRTATISTKQIQEIAFEPTLLQKVITGKITDQEWRSEITQKLAQEFPPADAALAITAWSTPVGQVDHYFLGALQTSPLGKQLVLVTNATTRLNQDLKALNLASQFTHIINSSAIGVAKPNPDYYRIALEQTGCDAQDVAYIDDSLPNVSAAKEMDIISHHFQSLQGLKDFLNSLTKPNQ